MTGKARYLNSLYKTGKLDNNNMKKAVEKNTITEEEYKEITGEDYEV